MVVHAFNPCIWEAEAGGFQFLGFFLLLLFFVLFFKTGFLCSFGACPGTCSVDQANFELTDTCLSLPPDYWDKDMSHYHLAGYPISRPGSLHS